MTTLVFNEPAAVAVVGGDRDFLGTILGIFLDELPRAIEVLESGVADKDADTVQKAAHKLKGEAGAIGAEALAEAAKALNDSARDVNVDVFAHQWGALRTEIDRLIPVIQRHCE